MQLLRTTIHGITTAYPSTATLDCERLGLVTAVVGPNGAGKSTLLGAGLLGALYREVPRLRGDRSRSLASLATTRGAYVESTISLGGIGTVTVRQTVDVGDERPESLVLLPSGANHPDLPTTSVKSFDAWAAKNLPAPEVTRAALFLSQQSHGLIHLTESARKAVILRALGSERLEKLADYARRQATSAVESLAKITGALDVAREGATSVVDARSAVAQAEHGHDLASQAEQAALQTMAVARRADALRVRRVELQERLRDLEWTHAQAEQDAAGLDQARQDAAEAVRLREAIRSLEDRAVQLGREVRQHEADAQQAQRAATEAAQRLAQVQQRWADERCRLTLEATRARAERDDYQHKRAEVAEIVARADEIRAASDRLALLSGSLQAERDALDEARRALAFAEAAEARASLELASAGDALKASVKAVEQLRDRLTDAAEVRDAVRSLTNTRDHLARIDDEIAKCIDEYEVLRSRAATSYQARHGALVLVVERIADGATGAHLVAQGGLDADDRADAEHAALPEKIERARTRLDGLRADRALIAKSVERQAFLATGIGDVERNEAALVQAEQAQRDAEDQVRTMACRWDAATSAVLEQEQVVATRTGNVERLATEVAPLQQVAALAVRLDMAAERAAELDGLIASADGRAARYGAEAASVPERSVDEIAEEHQRKRAAEDHAEHHRGLAMRARTDAEQARREALALCGDLDRLGAAESRVVAAERARERVAFLSAQMAAVTQEIDDVTQDALTYAFALPLSEGEALAEAATRASTDATVAVARAHDALARAVVIADKIDQLTLAKAEAALHVKRWQTLASDLGRDGLQADLVDAVVPELTDTANDLLGASFGGRYRMRFVAQKARADGSQVEGFVILVTDIQTGRTDEASNWSGGETALISTAASDALAVVACRAGNIYRPTLVRDESDAALNPALLRPWVEMVRRTAAIVKASRIFLISQRPETTPLCDSVVEIAGGTITPR